MPTGGRKNFQIILDPPLPRQLDELGLTQLMAMKATAPDLYVAMFDGINDVRLPADVFVRLSAGQLQPGDAGVLIAAYESQAQQCERLSRTPLTPE